MAKGFAGTVFLTTDDVQADYEELKAAASSSPTTRGAPVRRSTAASAIPSGNSFRLTQVNEAVVNQR
jgi:hypothetical protein